MPVYMAFMPIAALLLGAILILLLPRARAMHSRERGILVFLTASASFILSLALWVEMPLSVTISHWRPLAQFGCELAYHIDDLAITFVLLVTFTSAAAILTSLSSLFHGGSAYLYAAILTLLAADLSSFLSANLLTLCVSWGCLDLSILLLIGLHDGKKETAQDLTKALAASHLASLALLIAALRFGQSVGQAASLPTSVAFFLLLAALLRLGLYPLNLWLPNNVERSSPTIALLYILSTSAGMYLLVRLSALSPEGLPQRDTLLLVGGLALVASALILWQGVKSREWPFYLLANQSAYAVLAMALDTSPRGVMAALTQTLNLVIAWSVLFLRGKSGRVGERVILGIAIASLLGLPLTLGFPAHWLLYALALERGSTPLIVAGAVANLFTASSLFDASLDKKEGRLDGVGFIGLGLLAAPLLFFGVLPLVLPIKLLGGRIWLPSVRGGVAAWSLALILLPPFGGYLLHRWGRVLDRIGPILEKLSTIIGLEWLYRFLWWLPLKAGNILQGAMGTMEGARCLGWLLLSAFVVTLLLLGE